MPQDGIMGYMGVGREYKGVGRGVQRGKEIQNYCFME